MKEILYFKRQAKRMLKDYKTGIDHIDSSRNNNRKYTPRYFDIESLLFDYECNENDFSLMKAHHIIAYMVGFDKWADLLKASEAELALAKLLFDHQDKICREDWEMYISGAERDNKTTFDPNARLEIFKHVFLRDGHDTSRMDYRLMKT